MVAGPHAEGTVNETIAQIFIFWDVRRLGMSRFGGIWGTITTIFNFTHPHFVQSKTIPSFGGQEFQLLAESESLPHDF